MADKQSDPYYSEDDRELREYCVSFLAKLTYFQNCDAQTLCENAEELRNYLRFGVPYAPHWIATREKEEAEKKKDQ